MDCRARGGPTDYLSVDGVFEVTFPETDYRVTHVRVRLDTRLVSGWNEIDAVELVGPDARAWASDATASSSYATGDNPSVMDEGVLMPTLRERLTLYKIR